MEAANPVSLHSALPDHPRGESSGGAAVRIAMASAAADRAEGLPCKVGEEIPMGEEGALVPLHERAEIIHSDLTIGSAVAAAQAW